MPRETISMLTVELWFLILHGDYKGAEETCVFQFAYSN